MRLTVSTADLALVRPLPTAHGPISHRRIIVVEAGEVVARLVDREQALAVAREQAERDRAAALLAGSKEEIAVAEARYEAALAVTEAVAVEVVPH